MAMHRGPYEPGMRDRVIAIQQLTEGIDATSGEATEAWTTLVACMPAHKADIRGMERFVAAQESAKFDRRWEINYRLDMDPDLVDVPKTRRIVFNDRVEDIVSASEIGRREGIELMTLVSTTVVA